LFHEVNVLKGTDAKLGPLEKDVEKQIPSQLEVSALFHRN
jgi:hypothetical protein